MCLNKENLQKWGKDSKPLAKKIMAVSEVIVFTILPTITMMLYAILQNNNKLSDYIQNKCYFKGEFFLYSIALLSSAYTTIKVYKRQNTSLIIILLILVSICYTITINEDRNKPIDSTWLAVLSLCTFIAGVIFTWRAMSFQDIKTHDAQDNNDNSVEDINDGLQG